MGRYIILYDIIMYRSILHHSELYYAMLHRTMINIWCYAVSSRRKNFGIHLPYNLIDYPAQIRHSMLNQMHTAIADSGSKRDIRKLDSTLKESINFNSHRYRP